MPKPIEDNQQLSSRCHYCGYNLKGLEKEGKCPECGTEYTEESALRLKPRPGVLVICIRLGWPLFVVIGLYILLFNGALRGLFVGSIPVFFVVVPMNGYFWMRTMLKKHLPEQKRTQGFIAGLRVIGTVVAVVVFVWCVWFMLEWFILEGWH